MIKRVSLVTVYKKLMHWIRKYATKLSIDFIVIISVFTALYYVRTFTLLPYTTDAFLTTLLYAAIIMTSLWTFGIYRRIWSQTSGYGINLILQAMIPATVVIVLLNLLLNPRSIPLSVVLISMALIIGGLIVVRYRSRLIDAAAWRWKVIWPYPKKEQAGERVLIVGAGRSGQITAWRLKDGRNGGRVNIIGFVDDDPEKQGLYVESSPVLGTCKQIPRIAHNNSIDLIVVAIHNIDGPSFWRILEYCEATSARIQVVPDIENMLTDVGANFRLRDVEPEDLIGRVSVNRHPAISMKPVMNKVVLVTGAAGSIGSELARQLLDFSPKRLILLDNNESGLFDIVADLALRNPTIEMVDVLADITHVGHVRDIFETYRPELVYHAAAYKHVPLMEKYPNEAVRVNMGGTLHVAEAARDYGVERFVLISTDKAVRPSSIMGASKRVCEVLMHALADQPGHSTLFTAVRFGNVLGSRGSVVPIFEKQIKQRSPITITHPEMSRYFMSIPEASNLVIHAACLTQGNDIFVLRMGEEVRIVDIAERLIRIHGLRPNQDIPIVFTGVRPGEKLREELYRDDEDLCATDHPGIMRLATRPTISSEAFMNHMQQFIQYGLDTSTDNSLQKLLTLSGEAYEASDSNDNLRFPGT